MSRKVQVVQVDQRNRKVGDSNLRLSIYLDEM